MDTVMHHLVIDDQMINQGDVQAIIGPVWWTANIYEGEERYNDSFGTFSPQQRFIFAIMWYVAEVNNGGHDQFYANSTGIVWKDALAGFRELGIHEAASIIQESADRLGGNPSLDRVARTAQLDMSEPDFSDLDTRYYELEGHLFEVMQQYIRDHRSAFYFDGIVEIPRRWLEKPSF